MTSYRSFTRPLIVAAMLAATVLGSGAVRARTASAAPLFIKSIQVWPGGTDAAVLIVTSEPATVKVDRQPESARSAGLARQPGRPLEDVLPVGIAATEHRLHLRGLSSNTTYTLAVNATNASGQSAATHRSFTTLKQRVRLTLDTITIADDQDGDLGSKGEPIWFWNVGWEGGSDGGCYPYITHRPDDIVICQEGSINDGTTIAPKSRAGGPIQMIFAEENFATMPRAFNLDVDVTENDLSSQLYLDYGDLIEFLGGGGFSGPPAEGGTPTFTAPSDKLYASKTVTLDAIHEDRYGQDLRSVMQFTFEFFYDDQPYPPNHGYRHTHVIL